MAAEEVPGSVPPSINCYQCGALIDLTDQTAFTHVDCNQCGALSVVPMQFGNFLLLNPLGVGGMGTVYKAIDLSLNRNLALKILRKKMASKPEFIESFSREARAAAAVNHPNIAQVYSFGEHQNQYYLAMELLERGSLDDRITTLGKIAEKDVLDVGRQVAAGLRAAEQRSLLHRDIKPGNILFNDDNMPKIVDFGLARASDQTKNANEPIWGTPYYIAPEKLRGRDEDLRSDIYSLGATLYHSLAGRPPFDAATASEVVTKHATQPAFSLKTYAPDIQTQTAQVIGRMLSKNPADRYQTYEELIHALDGAIHHYREAHATRTIVASSGERIPVSSVIGTVVALVVCAVIVWFVWVNRVSIFKLEDGTAGGPPVPPPASVSGVPPGGAPGGTSPPSNGGVAPPRPGTRPPRNTIDFNEDAAWVKAWNIAMLELSQGRYQEAFQAYDSAKRLAGAERPLVRQWVQFFEGLTLLAADRPGMSINSFAKAVNPRAGRDVPKKITTANFVDPLVYTMLGELPVGQLEKEISRMPVWAVALTRVSIGFKQLEAGNLHQSAKAFRAYVDQPRTKENEWVYNLQPLADRLARQSDRALELITQADALLANGDADKADELYADHLAKFSRTIRPLLEKRRAALAPELAKLAEQRERERAQAEQRRLQAEAEARAHAEAEAKLVETVAPEVAPLLKRYDFRGALQKYTAFDQTVTSDLGHQAVQRRIDLVTLLVELKQQLMKDFARSPLPGGSLKTRTGSPLLGNLQRASETELYCATQYGELVHTWAELPPSEWIKLGVYYAGRRPPGEADAARGRRYLRLAAFAHQYGSSQVAQDAAKRALGLMPGEAELIRTLFGVE